MQTAAKPRRHAAGGSASPRASDEECKRAIARAVWSEIHWLMPRDRTVTITVQGDAIAVDLDVIWSVDPDMDRGGPGRAVPPATLTGAIPMELFTQEQRKRLIANGARGGDDHKPEVKLFNPSGNGTWLITELDPECPGEICFGLADLGMGYPELGSIFLEGAYGVPRTLRARHRARPALPPAVRHLRLCRGGTGRRAHRRVRPRA